MISGFKYIFRTSRLYRPDIYRDPDSKNLLKILLHPFKKAFLVLTWVRFKVR
jgi:hypothetical protein